ncbi:hypothetical protein A2671_01920 [Candidatus Kaiserbacteria bacterium RIFCSPHIGHO2_01_FULL_49_13]|uniref:Uncharacterized protein n=1 Tax=Candidatus Kaiserbacteria bacterium RIFCSPHIGHO2_01_FULL_49_13 TaxID=1798477 RepID=A0A1F6CDN3_9BACT|nr:MAG: hypothetical protein A2671_01920 [Candidatus Kaiserbacteria bacterium RIFCSPHIGHO2_01_FULL_49_13]
MNSEILKVTDLEIFGEWLTLRLNEDFGEGDLGPVRVSLGADGSVEAKFYIEGCSLSTVNGLNLDCLAELAEKAIKQWRLEHWPLFCLPVEFTCSSIYVHKGQNFCSSKNVTIR